MDSVRRIKDGAYEAVCDTTPKFSELLKQMYPQSVLTKVFEGPSGGKLRDEINECVDNISKTHQKMMKDCSWDGAALLGEVHSYERLPEPTVYRCSKCDTPNEYQPGPFTCFSCRSR